MIHGMMHPLQLAIATRSLGLPLRTALRRAAECGATGVQFDVRDELQTAELTDTGLRQFHHSLRELGLEVASASFPMRRTLYDAVQLDARVAALRSAMDFTARLKCRVLTLRIGPLPGDKEGAEFKTLVEVLNDLSRHGNHVGVSLALAPGGESSSAWLDLLAGVKTGPIGIDFDPCSVVCAGRNVNTVFRDLHALVTHVQARDGVRDLDGTGAEEAVGRGQVDWIELVALLHEAGYHGWLTAIRNQGSDRRGDVARAIDVLRNIFV
jgi:sugar phosphate isomerase/epimerase